MTLCARCHLIPPLAGRTRCRHCAALDREENGARYIKRGGHGGARCCPPGCTCLRHGSLARGSRPIVEREGATVRITCPRCHCRIAGTFNDLEVQQIVGEHLHRRRMARAQQMEIAA